MDRLSDILIEVSELLDEGAVKTSKKKKLDNYLRRHNYQGDKKEGTIEVDGEKYLVDRNINSKTARIKDIPRTISITVSDDKKIILNKDFLKFKNRIIESTIQETIDLLDKGSD